MRPHYPITCNEVRPLLLGELTVTTANILPLLGPMLYDPPNMYFLFGGLMLLSQTSDQKNIILSS